jgi:outer membrane protein assembly complex protein YaeT
LTAAVPAVTQELPWGRTVEAIRLETDAALPVEHFSPQIRQKVGEPLDRRKVAESLKDLFATGRFQELRADAVPRESGVELIFRGRATYFVGVVRVEGTPDVLDPRLLITAARLRLGNPVSDRDLDAAALRLASVLAESGYYRAEVSSRLDPDPNTQVADVTFTVDPGPAARLKEVEFVGELHATREHLLKVARWKPGIHLTSTNLERGTFRLHRFYAEQGRLMAAVNVKERLYDRESETEKLTVDIEVGPLVNVEIRGASLSKSERRTVLPFYQEGVVDETSLERGRRNLLDHFQRRGYYLAEIEYEHRETGGEASIEVVYHVALGEQGVFEGYAFRGNETLDAAQLAGVLTVEGQDWLHSRGVFTHELLRQDVLSLRAAYHNHGFLDVKVTPRLETAYEGRRGRLFLTFEIEEGPRWRVGNLAFHGLRNEFRNDVWPRLAVKPGRPFSPVHVLADRDSLLSFLADRGFPHALVTYETSSNPDTHTVDVTYEVETGREERIGSVFLLGNENTREGTIRRELTLERGEPLSQSQVLESQRRLYDLGIFSQVQIAPRDPQGTERDKTILVHVEEARRWTLVYGAGVEFQRLGSDRPEGELRASPRLSFGMSRLNVGGRAQSLTFRTRLSTLDRGGSLTYLVPRFPTRRDLAFRIHGLAERSRDVLTFTAEREEASVSLEKRWSAAAALVGRYSFRRVLVDAESLRINPEDIPLVSRPARVAMFGLSYANDHRDNPADATRGSYSLADLGVSSTRYGSQSNFVRISGQNATYHRIGAHFIFARNTRFAVQSTVGEVGERGQIPLPERFFMGGSESHRGFSINQAGPRDLVTGFPVGGLALFLNSLEMRIPFAEGRMGFVVFHDAGNVYSSVRLMKLLKVRQSSPTDFDYTAHAAGLGLRYRTPVGPVRFDVGYNLNPARFRVEDPQTGAVEIRRLPHWQYSLSIGQSF